jgi:methionyl-tRNA formyltransferase
VATLRTGDILFLISCHEILDTAARSQYRYALVLHASDLPKGRGWSPFVWQVLEGARRITVSLITAAELVDTGAIWHQLPVELTGLETFEELNTALFRCELALMNWAVEHIEGRSPQSQVGTPTYYKRRTPKESELDPDRSLRDQFDILRTADPVRYPAHVVIGGRRYILTLSPGDA